MRIGSTATFRHATLPQIYPAAQMGAFQNLSPGTILVSAGLRRLTHTCSRPDDPVTDWNEWSPQAVAAMNARNKVWISRFGLERAPYRWDLPTAELLFERGAISHASSRRSGPAVGLTGWRCWPLPDRFRMPAEGSSTARASFSCSLRSTDFECVPVRAQPAEASADRQ